MIENSFYHQLHRYGFPANATNFKNVFHTLTASDGDKRFYIGGDPDKVRVSQPDSMGTALMDGNIMVDVMAQEIGGIDETYLATPIIGKDVYAPLFGCGYYLYTGHELKYKVLNVGELPSPEETRYVKVEFSTEGTVADLIRHCWWYTYDWHVDKFLLLPDEGRLANLMRYRLQVATLRIGGTAEDRLADYGRVIAFLLSKVQLSDAERSILAPFIEQAPDHGTLAAIADKEGEIRRLVRKAHETPLEFMMEQHYDPRVQNADGD